MTAICAEVISIGDELSSGQRLDTNSQWISQRLSDLGITVLYHTTIADDLASNVDALRIASRRCNIIIVSGGLGPTADDLTREALSNAFDRELEFRTEAFEHIQALFASRKRPMPERNRVQAMFPRGSRVIDNRHGTAPGIDLSVNTFRSDGEIQACRLFALPGVPAEMKEMMLGQVEFRLRNEMELGKQQWFYRELKVFGIGESDCEAMLPEIIARDRIPRVGITVHQATITLRIAALAESQSDADEICASTVEIIHSHLGERVYGEGNVELQDVVIELLRKSGQSLVVFESGDASLIASKLSAAQSRLFASNASQTNEYYPFKNSTWHHQLRDCFRIATDEPWNLTSISQSASFRARCIEQAKESGSDWTLFAGPYPNMALKASDKDMPMTEFLITVVGPAHSIRSEVINIGGHPDILLERLAKTALDTLRKLLITIA